MRTKQLLKAVQTVGSDIQILLNYLALSGEHFGTHAIVDPFGKVLLEHKFHMTDKGEIVKTVVNSYIMHQGYLVKSSTKLVKLKIIIGVLTLTTM